MKTFIKENIQKMYEKYAKIFDEKIASLAIYNDSYNYLLNCIQDDSVILDLACGPGNVSFYIKKYKPALSITGVDISEEMIGIAKNRIPDGKFFVRDICEIEFKNEFDWAVCAFAIPYLDLEAADHLVKKINQSMRSNGIFYISFMEGSKNGFEKTSFTGNDELFVYYHPKEAVLKILEQQSLSVIKNFEIDYHEMDGTITKEIIYIGEKSYTG